MESEVWRPEGSNEMKVWQVSTNLGFFGKDAQQLSINLRALQFGYEK